MKALSTLKIIPIVLSLGLVSCGSDPRIESKDGGKESIADITAIVIRDGKAYGPRNSIVEKLSITDSVQFVELPSEVRVAKNIKQVEADYACYFMVTENDQSIRSAEPISGKATVRGQTIAMADIVGENILMAQPGLSAVVECDVKVRGVTTIGSTIKGVEQVLVFDTARSTGLSFANQTSTLDQNALIFDSITRTQVSIENLSLASQVELRCDSYKGKTIRRSNNTPLALDELIEDPTPHTPDTRITNPVQTCRIFEFNSDRTKKLWSQWFRFEFRATPLSREYEVRAIPYPRRSKHSRVLVGTYQFENTDSVNAKTVAFREAELSNAWFQMWGTLKVTAPVLANQDPLWIKEKARTHLTVDVSSNTSALVTESNTNEMLRTIEVPPATSVTINLFAENKRHKSCFDFIADDRLQGYELYFANETLTLYNFSPENKALGSSLWQLGANGRGSQRACINNCDKREYREKKKVRGDLGRRNKKCR